MGKYFVRRGEKCVPIKYNKDILDITIRVPTNREHDDMMEAHTEYGQGGLVSIHSAELIEDRLMQYIIDLPFEIPKDEAMESFVKWKDATEDEKRFAVNTMEQDLRESINDAITGKEEVDDKTAEN